MSSLRSIRPFLATGARKARRTPIRSFNYPHSSFTQSSIRFNSSSTAAAAAETASAAAESTAQTTKRGASALRRFVLTTALAVTGVVGYFYVTDTRAGVHRYVVVPLIRAAFDAEEAHHFGIEALKILYPLGLAPRERWNPEDKGELQVEVFGHTLSSPLAISGGLDKNADVPSALLALGPSIVEIGGITPRPQDGNPKPRVFRIPSQEALINRYGLPGIGADHVALRLSQRVREFARSKGYGYGALGEQRVLDGEAGVPAGSLVPGKLLAVQVSKQKETPEGDMEAVKKDYVYSVERVGKYADIITVNVSSPNTPGLRSLQQTGPLTDLLAAVVAAAGKIDRKTKLPVMVKVSPDEDTDEQIEGICEAVWASGVDGVIVANTTRSRPEPVPKGYALDDEEWDVLKNETGGYSSPQLYDKTLSLVKRYSKLLQFRPAPKKVEQASAKATTETIPSSTEPQKASDIAPSTLDKIDASWAKDEEKWNQPGTQEQSTSAPSSAPPAESIPSVDTAAIPSTSMTTSKYDDEPKVIFASGGITNGKQALEVLNAGASMAMVYTTMVYHGSGTITRMKEEMRQEIRKGGKM